MGPSPPLELLLDARFGSASGCADVDMIIVKP